MAVVAGATSHRPKGSQNFKTYGVGSAAVSACRQGVIADCQVIEALSAELLH
jgi:hypothetical protein